MQLPLSSNPHSNGVPQLITAIAAKLRDPDPAVRADYSERLVRALDRNNRPLEQVLGAAFNQPWSPPSAAQKPPAAPMGKMNWLAWCRFMLGENLNEWERKFIVNVMRQAGPSERQREKLREILLRLHPMGCGGWGQPKN